MPSISNAFLQVKNDLSHIEFPPKKACIYVAGLCYCFDSKSRGAPFLLPATYAPFLVSKQDAENNHCLVIHVDKDLTPLDSSTGQLICQTDIWDLRQTNQHSLVFTTKKSQSIRQLSINQDYSQAELIGRFKDLDGMLWHPLENLDMLVAVNWFAEKGDLALHASGAIVNGRGYAFLGESGAGKSTLAAALAKDQHALVLGEDQVVLRYVDGDFWIYGTPWHENPEMCSPIGAILAGVVFLDRKAEVGFQKIQPLDGVSRIMQTAFVPYYRTELITLILDRLTLLAKMVPFYCLNYPLGQDVYIDYLQNV